MKSARALTPVYPPVRTNALVCKCTDELMDPFSQGLVQILAVAALVGTAITCIIYREEIYWLMIFGCYWRTRLCWLNAKFHCCTMLPLRVAWMCELAADFCMICVFIRLTMASVCSYLCALCAERVLRSETIIDMSIHLANGIPAAEADMFLPSFYEAEVIEMEELS